MKEPQENSEKGTPMKGKSPKRPERKEKPVKPPNLPPHRNRGVRKVPSAKR